MTATGLFHLGYSLFVAGGSYLAGRSLVDVACDWWERRHPQPVDSLGWRPSAPPPGHVITEQLPRPGGNP
jgi:hypothetical protein